MRNLIIVAIWLAIGFGVTELVASYIEVQSQSANHVATPKFEDPALNARDIHAVGKRSP
jgi:hypothetical protein